MTRQHILDEIRRTAKANEGVALGRERFLKETGIRQTDWHGKYWVRWSDAVKEAGVLPNEFQDAFSDEVVIGKLAALTRELGRFPTHGDRRLKATHDRSFPTHGVFTRVGRNQELVNKVLEYCRVREGFEDVIALVAPLESSTPAESGDDEPAGVKADVGEVYLIKCGRYYKVGRSNASGRRAYELAIQLPEKAVTVHVIRTDDPPGIESYWHKRFEARRCNGEWFSLTKDDIAAFRRRKFM